MRFRSASGESGGRFSRPAALAVRGFVGAADDLRHLLLHAAAAAHGARIGGDLGGSGHGGREEVRRERRVGEEEKAWLWVL